MSGSHLSKEFFELVKSIGESKSKQEEDRIIQHEVATLKRKLQDPSGGGTGASEKKKKKEFLIRLLYVEMLGHDASFGYIKAVEMTASTNLVQKHVGYLACSLMLSPTHEFRFMIINQLQRDLQSSNHLEVCAALTAVCKLMTVEMIPAVQPMILDLLRHDAELVRKKAVMALHRFHQLQPEAMSDVDQALRRALCDRDPSVMGASLCLLHDICVQTPGAYKDLVPSFVSILKQITEHRLPREFDYHRIPAPWIQIRLLKLLALLGQADQQTSEGMYEVLHDVVRRADTGINVGYAIIYECVQTVTSIYPNSTLLDAAAASISRFISSENHNLKYLGVTGLAAIVKDHPRYAAQHQMAVIDCLEDPDETLKRKTLDLLYRMTNPVNVEFISDKLTQYLREATDVFLRRDLVSRITQCAERYAPSNAWYIQTMTNVFELGGELVEPEVAHNLLRLIAEGSGEDEEQDMELRRDAVDTYLDLLEQPKLPDLLVRTMAWVLGEYGYLSDVMPQEELCERMCELVDRPFDDEDMTRGYVLSAVTKITAQMGHSIDAADALMYKYKRSRSSDLQQRCFEYLAMTSNPRVMTDVYPEDASCEDIEIDPNMPFLSAFVERALANGAPAYDPPEDSDEDEDFASRSKGADGLNFEAYQKPEMPYAMKPPPQQPDPTAGRWGQHQLQSTQSQPPQDQAAGFGAPRNPRGNVWGPSGLSNPNESAEQYPPAPQPPPMDAQPPVQPQNMYAQPPPANTYGYSGGYVDEDVADDLSEQEEVEQPVDERQVMASALFGGISGGPAPATAAPRRSPGGRPPRRASGTARQPTRRQSGRQELSHSQSSNPTAPPQQPQSNLDMDLLDMTFDSAPRQQPPTQASSQSSDPFGMTSSNPPVQTAYSPVSSEPSVSSSQPSQAMPSQDPFNMAGLASSINDPPQAGDPFQMTGMSSGMPSMSTGMPGEMTSSMHSANLGISMGSGSGAFEYQGRTLEPWQITTQDFGGRWGACPCERKIKITLSTVHTLDDFATRARQFNVHLVEAIPATNEAIAAGRLANSEHVVLIHIKVRNGGLVDLTVRTADTGLTEQLLEAFSQRLH